MTRSPSHQRSTPEGRRRLAAIVGLVAVAATVLTLAAPPAAADNAADEVRLYQLTNAARAAHGFGPLAYDAGLSNVARAWTAEMVRTGQLRHNPNVVAQVDAQVTAQWTLLGENVGYALTIDQVQAAFMGSPSHKNTILGGFNRVGVAAIRASSGLVWTTLIFLQGPPLPPAVPVATFAPFPSADAFVRQQYPDFLGRAADASGLNYWVTLLLTGRVAPIGLVDSFINSPEFGQVVEPVARLYLAYFGRDADFAGLMFWSGHVRAGLPLAAVSESFAGSAEFRARYGTLSNQGFVDRVYRNVLGRPPDAGGAAYWGDLLARGVLNRGGVMVNFSESAEYRWGTWARIDVVAAYLGFLRRSPDAAGLSYWTGTLYSGQGMGALIAGFLSSAEYRARLGL